MRGWNRNEADSYVRAIGLLILQNENAVNLYRNRFPLTMDSARFCLAHSFCRELLSSSAYEDAGIPFTMEQNQAIKYQCRHLYESLRQESLNFKCAKSLSSKRCLNPIGIKHSLANLLRYLQILFNKHLKLCDLKTF